MLQDACTPSLFSPPPSEWGDAVEPNDAPSLSPEKPHEETSEVPKVLSDLFSSGTRFETAPKFTWNLKAPSHGVRLRRELSVVFSVDTPVTSQDIIHGFYDVGIDVDQILSIQRRASNNTWVVSFRTPEIKSVALGVPFVKIAGCTVFLGDCENRVQIVKIYEAPAEMPDSVLIGRLSHYGKVFSFRRDKSTSIIYNGVRTARMRLNLVIPPTICIAGELIRVWYPTQPKMCRRCGDSSHIAAKCTSFRCFNCEVPGHRVEECPSKIHCSICLSLDHAVLACPFLLYSANVVDQPDDVPEAISPPVPSTSYAKAASHSPEQVEAIKAARAAGSGSKQPSESQPSASQSSSSSKQAPKHFSKKAASEPPPSVPPSPEKQAEREREHSRECRSGRDRDRDRERASARDRDRDRDRHRDCSREGERDRSGRCHHHHHHHHDSQSSAEESDDDFIEVRSKRRSRR